MIFGRLHLPSRLGQARDGIHLVRAEQRPNPHRRDSAPRLFGQRFPKRQGGAEHIDGPRGVGLEPRAAAQGIAAEHAIRADVNEARVAVRAQRGHVAHRVGVQRESRCRVPFGGVRVARGGAIDQSVEGKAIECPAQRAGQGEARTVASHRQQLDRTGVRRMHALDFRAELPGRAKQHDFCPPHSAPGMATVAAAAHPAPVGQPAAREDEQEAGTCRDSAVGDYTTTWKAHRHLASTARGTRCRRPA